MHDPESEYGSEVSHSIIWECSYTAVCDFCMKHNGVWMAVGFAIVDDTPLCFLNLMQAVAEPLEMDVDIASCGDCI